MSWEIKGSVSTAADVDGLVAAPSQIPSDAESQQVAGVAQAVKDLLGLVGGPLVVRAGGHANPGGGPAEGAPNEMVTLTIDYAVPAEPEPEPEGEPELNATSTEPDPSPEG